MSEIQEKTVSDEVFIAVMRAQRTGRSLDILSLVRIHHKYESLMDTNLNKYVERKLFATLAEVRELVS